MKKYIIPIMILLIVAGGIIFWIYFIYFPYIKLGCFETAGQVGSSFGFFNTLALLLLTITLFYQIKEYNANRDDSKKSNELKSIILQKEITYNQYAKIHETLLKEFDRYNELYLKYLTIFEEINAGKTHLIPTKKLVDLSKGMFQRFFIRITKEYNQYISNTFEYKGIEFDKIGPDETDISIGSRVFNNIKENLDNFFKCINNSFENNNKEVLKELKMIIK